MTRPADEPKARLSQFLRTGEVEIVTVDPDVVRQAAAARLNQTIETFVYWNGEEEDTVIGRVTSIRPEEHPVRFSVMAEEE